MSPWRRATWSSSTTCAPAISALSATAEGAALAAAGAADERERTSAAALAEAMDAGDNSDIRVDPGLSNCLVFHTGGLPGSMLDPEIISLRERVDAGVNALVRKFVEGIPEPVAMVSGHLWYPAGSAMGWHTNSRVPGWRLYLTHVDVPHRSYFRYRNPGRRQHRHELGHRLGPQAVPYATGAPPLAFRVRGYRQGQLRLPARRGIGAGQFATRWCRRSSRSLRPAAIPRSCSRHHAVRGHQPCVPGAASPWVRDPGDGH